MRRRTKPTCDEVDPATISCPCGRIGFVDRGPNAAVRYPCRELFLKDCGRPYEPDYNDPQPFRHKVDENIGISLDARDGQ